jgi:hypothetical protein
LGRLGLAATLERAGKRSEPIDNRREVAKTCLSLDREALAAAGEVIEQLVTYPDNSGDGGPMLKQGEAIKIDARRLFFDGESLVPQQEPIERPVPQLENSEDGALLLKLKNKLDVLKRERDIKDRLVRRQEAATRILSGDYSGAEALLRELLQEKFAVPSTHCHLARVLLMTDREAEARQEINQAWATRKEAPAYVVLRILFFQCAFTMLDAADTTTHSRADKSYLRESGAHLDYPADARSPALAIGRNELPVSESAGGGAQQCQRHAAPR